MSREAQIISCEIYGWNTANNTAQIVKFTTVEGHLEVQARYDKN